MTDSTVLVITLPKATAPTETAPEAPTPREREVITALDSAVMLRLPPVAVTVELSIVVNTVLVMTLPVRFTSTATRPEPDTLMFMARMLASVKESAPKGDSVSSKAAVTSSSLSAGTFNADTVSGAMSEAARLTSVPAVTVASVMSAVTLLTTVLPMALTVTATAPEPDTPRLRDRITAEDSESRLTAPPAATVEPVTAVAMSLVMTLADSTAPTATPPVPDTPKATESILELSFASRATSPPAVTVDGADAPSFIEPSSLNTRSVMDASVVLVITLAARESWTLTTPEAATPPAKP